MKASPLQRFRQPSKCNGPLTSIPQDLAHHSSKPSATNGKSDQIYFFLHRTLKLAFAQLGRCANFRPAQQWIGYKRKKTIVHLTDRIHFFRVISLRQTPLKDSTFLQERLETPIEAQFKLARRPA